MHRLFPSILLALYVLEGKIEMGLLSRIGDRLDLMSRMSSVTGVANDREAAISIENGVQGAIWHCLGCRNVEECKQWLASHEEEAAAPDFCANAAMFNMARDHG
jgi:hypothetical protein